jgi:hypothetical protein
LSNTVGGDPSAGHWPLRPSRQFAIQAFEAATASGQPDAVMMFGAQVANVRYSQGR